MVGKQAAFLLAGCQWLAGWLAGYMYSCSTGRYSVYLCSYAVPTCVHVLVPTDRVLDQNVSNEYILQYTLRSRSTPWGSTVRAVLVALPVLRMSSRALDVYYSCTAASKQYSGRGVSGEWLMSE